MPGEENSNPLGKNSTSIQATVDFKMNSKFKDVQMWKIYNLKSVTYGRQINKSMEEICKSLENKYWAYDLKKKIKPQHMIKTANQ